MKRKILISAFVAVMLVITMLLSSCGGSIAHAKSYFDIFDKEMPFEEAAEIGTKKVIGVIVTHYHFDHIGALSYFDKNIIYYITYSTI